MKHINRLAAELLRRDAGQREKLAELRCHRCGNVSYANVRIFFADEPFNCCENPLYNPHAPNGRDGYWWASAVLGHDPEARYGAELSESRAKYLASECASVGLIFGDPTIRHVVLTQLGRRDGHDE